MGILKVFGTSDYELKKLMDACTLAFNIITSKQILQGNLVTTQVLTSGIDNVINHGLNRRYIGNIIIDKNANEQIWTSTTTNSFPEKQILLKASGTVTISLWIF